MAARSLVDLGLTVVGWWMIVATPVSVLLRTVSHTGVVSGATLALSVLVAGPLAGLHWWFGKSLRRLADYIFSLVAYQLVIGSAGLVAIATFNITIPTASVPGALLTGGMLCMVYLCAYFRTYGDGPGRSWRETIARSE